MPNKFLNLIKPKNNIIDLNCLKKHNYSIDESSVVEKYFKYLKIKKGIMFDVGAFRGSSADYFIKKKWDAHLFEPNKVMFEVLRNKYEKLNNITLSNLAVDEVSNKSVDLYLSNESIAIASLLNFHKSHYLGEKVSTISLKDYIKNNNIHKVNYLKVDTEGMDLFVLRGFDWNLLKPEIITVEYEYSKSIQLNYTPDQLASFLQDKNYEVYVSEWYPIEKYGSKHSIKSFYKYEPNIIPNDSWGNLIAFLTKPNEKKLLKLFMSDLVRY